MIKKAADKGDKDAQAWLNGEGYISVLPDKSIFVRYDYPWMRYSERANEWRRFHGDIYVNVS